MVWKRRENVYRIFECFVLALEFSFQVELPDWRPWPHFPLHLANFPFSISRFVNLFSNLQDSWDLCGIEEEYQNQHMIFFLGNGYYNLLKQKKTYKCSPRRLDFLQASAWVGSEAYEGGCSERRLPSRVPAAAATRIPWRDFLPRSQMGRDLRSAKFSHKTKKHNLQFGILKFCWFPSPL